MRQLRSVKVKLITLTFSSVVDRPFASLARYGFHLLVNYVVSENSMTKIALTDSMTLIRGSECLVSFTLNRMHLISL